MSSTSYVAHSEDDLREMLAAVSASSIDDLFAEIPEEVRRREPLALTAGLSEAQLEKMVDVALVLEPLWENALGKQWRQKMTRERIRELYRRM